MFVRNAATIFLTIGLLGKDALAELITITQYASTCSAIYTTGSRSITIVQSTTTVAPVAYDDAAWNGGTPFVLGIETDAPTDPLARRAHLTGRSWLTLNGNTSTDPLSAGQYYIRGGQLLSVNGSYVSTNLNIDSQALSIMNPPGAISTTFSFKDGVLNWTSPRFTTGRAKICKQPVNLVNNAEILCQFLGDAPSPDSCAPIKLVATPCAEVNPLSSSSVAPTGTISMSTSMGMQSMSSGAPDQYTPPPYSSQPPRSSSSVVLPPLSTPAAYTSAPSSTSVSSTSSPVATSKTSTTSPNAPSSTPVPPVYGSPTPSPSPTRTSSSSSSSVISFASSASPIGPDNPPAYESTSYSSISSSSSVSISSGGVRSSASATSSTLSSTSSMVMPPVYPSETPPTSSSVSRAPSSSSIASSTSSSSPSSTVSSTSSISFASSQSRPPLYTPPAVTPSSTASSTASSTMSSSSSSLLPPVVYPESSSTSISLSTSIPLPSTSISLPITTSLSSPVLIPSLSSSSSSSSSSSAISPPLYTGTAPQPCPGGNNTIYIDAAGMAYTIYCDLDSVPGSYAPPEPLDFASCIQRCDLDPSCGSVSHTTGVDRDFCYFKKTPESYSPAPGTDLAVRVAGAPPVYSGASSSTASSSSSVMTSSSSPVASSSSSSTAPDQYQGPTTTTTTTTSSSTSSQVPDQYGQTTTSSSSSIEVPDQYAQTTTTTSTTTTSSSSSSSSAASSSIPYSSYLVLPSPTPCDFGDPPTYDEDDSYCEVDLPFPIQLYGASSVRTFASSNGYISLDRGSQQFQVNRFPYSAIPPSTVAPFFDDTALYGRKNPRQGIYYQIDGTKVTWEYYLGRSAQADTDKARLSQSIYHYTMEYDSTAPNVFVYTYYSLGSTAQQDPGVNGASAAVGMQGVDANGQTIATTFSFRDVVLPGTIISCNGLTNSCANIRLP